MGKAASEGETFKIASVCPSTGNHEIDVYLIDKLYAIRAVCIILIIDCLEEGVVLHVEYLTRHLCIACNNRSYYYLVLVIQSRCGFNRGVDGMREAIPTLCLIKRISSQ